MPEPDPKTYRTYGRARALRLDNDAYATPETFYLITICCRDRRNDLALEGVAQQIIDVSRETVRRYNYRLWALCIMPDHLHALLSSKKDPAPLHEVVRDIKGLSFHRVKSIGELYWQRSYHDHILRPEEDAYSVANYIVNNPVRANLADHWENWPHTYTDPDLFA